MTSPRVLLGYTVPDHMTIKTGTDRVHHITCRHFSHEGGFPGWNIQEREERAPTKVGNFFRFHSHGVSVEYRPEPRQAEEAGCCTACNGTGSVEPGYPCEDCYATGHCHLETVSCDGRDVDPAPASSVAVSATNATSPEQGGQEGHSEAQGAAEALGDVIRASVPTVVRWDEAVEIAGALLAAGWLPPSGPLPEWCCPSCGATTRARLADKVGTDLKGNPLPDSETEWGWRRKPGSITDFGSHVRGGFSEAYARERVAAIPDSRVLVRREVGPWAAVEESMDASGDAG